MVSAAPDLRSQIAAVHNDAFAWAMCCCAGHQSEAEDVLQTAYLRVLCGRARFGGQSTVKTWLFGIIRNVARERSRKHNQRAKILRLRRTTPPEVQQPNRDDAQALALAIQTLSERQQEVLHLVFYQEMTLEEVAQALDIALGSARTHYHRAKQHIREYLAERNAP